MRAILIMLMALWSGIPALAGKAEPVGDKTGSKSADGAGARASKKVQHAAVGAKVTASSTNKEFEDEKGPEALVDGDLGTRWSSAYSAPQRITIDFGKEVSIAEIKLHWESAFATKYHILISDDGEGWTPAHFFFRLGTKTEVRVDSCKMKGVKARHIMVELDERVNSEWGFSLYEIEVIPVSAEPVTP